MTTTSVTTRATELAFQRTPGAAKWESISSQLPGRENGPADAYRHILWVAEMTRRFGQETARRVAANKEKSDLGDTPSTLTKEAVRMDRWNNEIGVRIGRSAGTWNDVIRITREIIEQSPGDGTNLSANLLGGASWLDEAKWLKNPQREDPKTGKVMVDPVTSKPIRLKNADPEINWRKRPGQPLNWQGKHQPNNFHYPFGGAENRFDPDRKELMSEPMGMARNEAPPSRPGERQAEETRTAGIADDLLLSPKAMSFESRERVADRLGFDPRAAEGDAEKGVKLARCQQDCFVKEPGFAGLPGGIDRQLGAIGAATRPELALAVVRGVVPGAAPAEPTRRRIQRPPRLRLSEPDTLDEAGRGAVRQAIQRHGPARIRREIAFGTVGKAADALSRNAMIPPVFISAIGAGFARRW